MAFVVVVVPFSARQLTRAGAAVSDGAPIVRGIWPQTSPTAGGGVVRIYGTGLDGATEVSFGTQASRDFKVIDSNLITAVVPAAAVADNTAVDVTATDAQGTSTHDPAVAFSFLYTDASITLSPSTGLSTGSAVAATVKGYIAGFTGSVAEFSPLAAYVEGAPASPPAVPPPYEDLDFAPTATTDGSGNATITANLPAFRSGADPGYDPKGTCPVSQEAADFGIGHCGLSLTTSTGPPNLERSVNLSNDPVPRAPTLSLSSAAGGKVVITGTNWNAAPLFGSAATPDSPGQTKLTVELCTAELGDCRAMTGDAAVAMTRYTDTDRAAGVQGRFRGATLAGSVTTGATRGCGKTCMVRVTQQPADPDPGRPRQAAISAVSALSALPALRGVAPLGPGPAAARGRAPAADGRPFVSRFWPQTSPTHGGRPVRIYGSGFGGTTKVTFGTKPARFAVIDGHLLTAVAPPVPGGVDNAMVAITVTDAQGASNAAPGFLFTDASLTVDPDNALAAGAPTTVAVAGYQPATSTTIREVSPLAAFVEDSPAPPAGTFPYADKLGAATADPTGSSSSPVTLSDPFVGGSASYDANSACPPTQQQADVGLDSCNIVVGADGGGAMAHAIRFTGQPLPNPDSPGQPILTTLGSAHLGDRIALSGTNWYAAPEFGSSTTPLAPGQTQLTLELCKYQGACSPAQGTATVDVTRYVDTNPGDTTVQGELRGATLSGSVVVDNSSGCFPTCVLQVSQQAFDPDLGVAVSSTISTSALLRLTDGPPLAVRTWPQTSPTAGGVPVRIYGQGLRGATSVTFGTQDAQNFQIVDSGLIFAVVPPALGGAADDNTPVGVTVTDPEGRFTTDASFLYTDASLTVTPDSGLAPGGSTTVDVTGYKPSAPAVAAEANPLLGFTENGPPPTAGALPYRVDKASPVTDGAGNSTSTVQLSPAGPVGAPGYDANSTCPVTQQAADFGLGRCEILYDQAGAGGLVRPIALTGDPVPAKPVISVSPNSAFEGDTLTLGGTGWTAAPEFGSFTASFGSNEIGPTPMAIDVCTPDLASCATGIGPHDFVRATPTRVVDGTTGDSRVEAKFSGGVLSGSFNINDNSRCSPNCVVRVRQQRFDPVLRAPVDDFIEATVPVRIIKDTPQSFVGYTPFSGQAGTRVTLYGRGAASLTGVDFAGVPGTDFRFGADGSAMVTVPAGPSGLIDLTFHGGPNDGLVIVGGFFVKPADFSYTIEPTTNLHTGDTVRVTVHHYIPNARVILALVSPLINFVEPPPGVGPPAAGSIPLQVLPIFSPALLTDGDGNVVGDQQLPDFANRGGGDPQAMCGVTANQANKGLSHCIASLSLFSQGIVEVPLGYADDAVAAPPQLSLGSGNAQAGDRVVLNGFTWHGSPHTGSSQAAGDLHVDICGIGGNPAACRPAPGNVSVARTRYIFTPAKPADGQLLGADLSGSITVPDVGTADCGNCVVRVRQGVVGTNTFLEATQPLSIRGQHTTPGFTGIPPTIPPATRPGPRLVPVLPVPLTPLRPGPVNGLPPSVTPNLVPAPPPPPVPPSGAGAPGVSPGVAPTPGQASAPTPGQASAPGQANAPSPGAADVSEGQVQGAGATRHLMVRHVADSTAAGGAQAAAALAAAAAGCLMVVGCGLPARRRRRASVGMRRGVPRPRGGY